MVEEFRTPEGELIRSEIDRAGMSIRAVAREVGISDTQLRNWYRGLDRRGEAVTFSDANLARVARVLGMTNAQLREVGRAEAGDYLDRITRDVPAAQTYTPEEVARLIQGMAKRLGEIEEQNAELIERIDEIEGDN